MPAMRFDILSLFPEMFGAVLNSSMMRIAQEKGLVEFHLRNFRDFAGGFHRHVDDRPFGGGPGMVLKPEPLIACLESFLPPPDARPPVLLLSPEGQVLDQALARELSLEPWLVLVCGHYEGFDERVHQLCPMREISIGDYVLTGGELPALVLLDAIVRLRPDVLGDADSAVRESFEDGLLDHPHYTRPVEYRGLTVPEVLRSGDHARIEAWRQEQARLRTAARRPDLLPPDHDPGSSA